MIRSKIAMGCFWVLLSLALHVSPGIVAPTHGRPRPGWPGGGQTQSSRKDDIVFNTRGIPLAGATVRVCAMPASGQPCTPLAQIYSDPGLTQALANPTTTDGLGNYFFYAAPGKYEIEISGPGITTKQLANVILPNDPSAPTFSSLTSSGAISAFSLNLSGNLSVTGNATVLGSLVSGTVNMTNQSSAPGTPASGTVNLYTKTADKRLYYKDDTGAEIGPIAATSGAQTNVVNTFTAQQNFDSDTRFGGPNPWYDIRKYGGYSSTTSTPPSTTGSITSGQTTLTLGSAQDFANGQGIVVWLAGPAPTVSTPGTPTVTPINLVNGSTTYNYRVVAEDRNGGLSAASAVGTTTTGQATLGQNNLNFLTSCVRTSAGIATYTSSVSHNLAVGTQVYLSGFSGGTGYCNGVKTIASVPTGTTFTTNDGFGTPETNNTSGTASVFACNQLDFLTGSYSGASTIHYWIYRSQGAGAYSLIGVAQGLDPWYQDCGLPGPAVPGYVPSTPPASTQNGYLATTISAGGGTTILTLANAASATVTSQTVLHDNSKPLLACLQDAINTVTPGGTCYVPASGYNWWVFNATTNFGSLTNPTSSSVRLHLNTGRTWLNQPWLLGNYDDIEGEPHGTTSFQYVNGSDIFGNAYPLTAAPGPGSGTATHFSRILLHCTQSQQSCFLGDSNNGGGVVGLVFDDVSFLGSNNNGKPVVIKGGFDFYFSRGVIAGGANAFSPNAAYTSQFGSPATANGNAPQLANRTFMDKIFFAGTGILLECAPNQSQPATGHGYEIKHTLYESVAMPFFRANCTSNGQIGGVSFDWLELSDAIGGVGTPVVDLVNASNFPGVLFRETYPTGQPLVAGKGSIFYNEGNTPPVSNNASTSLGAGSIIVSGTNSSIQAASGGLIGYMLGVPPAPASAVVSAGGSVPIGTHSYCYEGVDVSGHATTLGSCVTATTTSGNQTVTVTPPSASSFPSGTSGMYIFRDGARGPGGGALCSPVAITYVLVDTFGFSCGQSQDAFSVATTSQIGSGGVVANGLTEVANGFTLTHTSPNISANRTYTNPDVTGYVPVTSYVNTAYDNATRANGAIGANWTVTNNGINISSNNFVGTTSNNDVAYWSASPFSASQYAQVTLTALNGTTDFPGVAVLLSGSGGSTQGYNCVEDTTNIFIQKISGTSNTTLASAATSGAAGDVLRLEVAPGGALTCYKNAVSTLTTTDTTYTSGSPGLFLFGTVATAKNWSGGNLHPLAHLDIEQDWSKAQHFLGGITLGSESLSSSPRAEQNIFFPGALTSTWTGATWTTDKAVTVTRVQVQVKTAPSGCTTNAVVRLTDGGTPVNVTISAAANDSGALAQNYAAGAALTVAVQTAAAGCTTSPADANVVVQYRMQ